MKLGNKLLCSAGMFFLLGSHTLIAAETSAKDILHHAFGYLSSLDKYAFNAVVIDSYSHANKVEKSKRTVAVKLERPDNLRVDIQGENRDRTNYMHDGKYIIVDHAFGYYAEIDTPKDIDKTLDFLIESFGINAPLTSLLYKDMGKRIHFTSSRYFGETDVSGTPCDYVAFKNNDTTVHVWIAKGDKPLVKAYAVIGTDKEDGYRIDTSVHWQDASTIKASDFIFAAPKDVAKISIEPAN